METMTNSPSFTEAVEKAIKPETATIEREETRIYKARDGWTGKTVVTCDGYTWQISTYKHYNGILVTTAHECKITTSNGMRMMSFEMFGSKNITLVAERVTATEKAVREQHYKALTVFEQKREAGELPKVKPEDILKVGQIVTFYGYAMNKESGRLAVYELIDSSIGNGGKLVDLDNFELSQSDRIEPESQKFGIGHYFTPGNMADPIEIGEALKKAKEKAEQRRKEKEAAEIQAAEQRKADIEAGAKIVPAIPAWAKCIIVGKLKKDDSDIMTDYFSSHTEKTVYLAYSSHDRDLFPELRQAAGNCPDTAQYATPAAPDHNMNGGYPKDEHREKYSMGNGYYLANHRYSGWQVQKTSLGGNWGVTLEQLQIAAAQGRYFCPEQAAPVQGTTTGEGVTVSRNEARNGIEIRFNGRPSDEVLSSLKAHGWRWARFNKVWYTHYSERAWAFAQSFVGGTVSSPDPAAGTIQAQEEAAADNFCMNNNI